MVEMIMIKNDKKEILKYHNHHKNLRSTFNIFN